MYYYNYLTTPSGKYCILHEMSNKEYLVLLKFLQADNYKGFFDNLNEKIYETIKDFDSFNIVDKCYVYLALCVYSVRSVAKVSNNFIGDQDVELTLLLNNIEKCFQDKRIYFQINDKIKITFGVPTKFYVDKSNNIVIDYLSNVLEINDKKLSIEEKEKFLSSISTKLKLQMEEKVMSNLLDKFDIFDGVPMNKLELPLYRFPLIFNIANIYRMGLKSFYDVLYMCTKHAKMSYDGFMDLSYMETDIILKTCLEEKQREAEQMNSALGQDSNHG